MPHACGFQGAVFDISFECLALSPVKHVAPRQTNSIITRRSNPNSYCAVSASC